jgi:hypothetical protein
VQPERSAAFPPKNTSVASTKTGKRIAPDQSMYPKKLGIRTPIPRAMA